jgi:hypothetical protein
VISLSSEAGKEMRVGEVLMKNGESAYMYEDILRTRFPEKLIEYYESEMRRANHV